MHGSASKEDMATIRQRVPRDDTGLQARVYFDYVPSKANMADLPSRGDYVIPRMLGAARGRMKVPSNISAAAAAAACMDRRSRGGGGVSMRARARESEVHTRRMDAHPGVGTCDSAVQVRPIPGSKPHEALRPVRASGASTERGTRVETAAHKLCVRLALVSCPEV